MCMRSSACLFQYGISNVGSQFRFCVGHSALCFVSSFSVASLSV